VDFVLGEVSGVDTRHRTLRFTDGDTLAFDYLVVATGARTRFPDFIEGLRDHSFGVKHLSRAYGFRHRFEEVVKKKLDGNETPVNLVVAGAGLSGVEVAAEMAYMLGRYRNSLGARAHTITVTLLDACETILPGMHPYLVESSLRRLEALGVRVRTSSFIIRIDETRIHLESGGALPYTFIVFTGGIEAATGYLGADFERNEIGQLKVENALTLPGHPHIYAIGDAADIRDERDAPCHPRHSWPKRVRNM
jgi:NADH dehydrogenase